MTAAILVVEITALIAAAVLAAFCIEYHRRPLNSKGGAE